MSPPELPASLPSALEAFAAERPDAVALREKELGVWRETTWTEYYRNVQATGRMLWELGVHPGDHVAIISDNRCEWLYADLGAQGIGARSVGIYQTSPAADVRYILGHCGAKVLFCEDQEQLDKAVEIAADTPTVERVVVFDPRGTRHCDDPRLMLWRDFVSVGRERIAEEPSWFAERLAERDPDEPAMVVYTSGTTGTPKGALLSSRNVMEIGQQATDVFGCGPGDALLSYLPLCHVAEKIFTFFIPLRSGAVVHFGESLATIREDLSEVSPTIFLGVPRIWEKMHASITLKIKDSSWLKRRLFNWLCTQGREIAARRRVGALGWLERVIWRVGDLLVYRPLQERLGLRRCRLPISGAAPVSPELIAWFHGVGISIVEGYGQTEGSGVSHLNRPNAVRIGTVGQALPDTECRLADDREILVRSSSVFRGYLHDPEATARTVDSEGWLATGDVGDIDAEGYLTITGRKKEIIITAGGKNLSPEKIENALKLSSYIKEAVSIGDGRKFISALIQIDYDAAGDWAARNGITHSSFQDLTTKQPLRDLIAKEINRCNESLARVEQVRAFELFPKELHEDDGELTPTQKVRRRNIYELYDGLIASLYEGARDG